MEIQKQIIRMAVENGATMAGIADMEALRASASHTLYGKIDRYPVEDVGKDFDRLPDNEFIDTPETGHPPPLFSWPVGVKSVLVVGLWHPKHKPELDWWDGRGTPGNRILIDIIKQTSRQIEDELNINTRKLHYYVEKGGIFLKDAAVLAGLGCIGKNNMLLTPSVGPRIRLRALFLDLAIQPAGPAAFDPCTGCRVYCRRVCPEKAMDETPSVLNALEFAGPLPGRDGRYDRKRCSIRMNKDVAEGSENSLDNPSAIKFCRQCEFVCPAGNDQPNSRFEHKQITKAPVAESQRIH